MKVTLELEVGMETGTIAGGLELVISNLTEAARLQGAPTDAPMIMCAKRLAKTLDEKVQSDLRMY